MNGANMYQNTPHAQNTKMFNNQLPQPEATLSSPMPNFNFNQSQARDAQPKVIVRRLFE